MAPLTTVGHDESLATPRAGWVLYDSDCGICTRLARYWTPTLCRIGLMVAPLQSPWVSHRTGLSRNELLSSIRLLENGGRLFSGPEVYRYVMRRLWWAYPLYLLSRIPGLSRLFDWGYHVIARNRAAISPRCGVPRE